MKVKVHWVIDGIAEIEAKDLEEAEVGSIDAIERLISLKLPGSTRLWILSLADKP